MKTKRFINAVITLLIVLSITLFCITLSACARSNEADKEAAEKLAVKEAEGYYNEYFRGKSFGSGSSAGYYKGCNTTIKSSKFSGGKYVIEVELEVQSSPVEYPGYTYRQKLPITYTIRIMPDGSPELVKTELGDWE